MSKPKYSHMISDISNLRVKKEMSGEDMTIWEQNSRDSWCSSCAKETVYISGINKNTKNILDLI